MDKEIQREAGHRKYTKKWSLSEGQDGQIIANVERQPLTTCVTIKKQLILSVGAQTVRNRLHEAGWFLTI